MCYVYNKNISTTRVGLIIVYKIVESIVASIYRDRGYVKKLPFQYTFNNITNTHTHTD